MTGSQPRGKCWFIAHEAKCTFCVIWKMPEKRLCIRNCTSPKWWKRLSLGEYPNPATKSGGWVERAWAAWSRRRRQGIAAQKDIDPRTESIRFFLKSKSRACGLYIWWECGEALTQTSLGSWFSVFQGCFMRESMVHKLGKREDHGCKTLSWNQLKLDLRENFKPYEHARLLFEAWYLAKQNGDTREYIQRKKD